MLRCRLVLALSLCGLLGCRPADRLAPGELLSGRSIAVRLVSYTIAGQGSKIAIAAVQDSVRVIWQYDEWDCQPMSASAAFEADVLIVEFARISDPTAD